MGSLVLSAVLSPVLLPVFFLAISASAVNRPEGPGPEDKIFARKVLLSRTRPLDSRAGEDFADFFTEGEIVRKPQEIDARGLGRAEVARETWSGSTWSAYRGASAQRYGEKAALNARDWPKARGLVTSPGRSFAEIAGRRNESEINKLSLSEKYDLLIGADPGSGGELSRHQWREGEIWMEKKGYVPTWFGYCHGWAPASILVPRAQHAVTVLAADGVTPVKFYPEDIKGLATVLYANTDPKIKILGFRCDTPNPPRDKNGRVIDEKCLDVNPGTFYLALVNQLGIRRQHLIIDATFDQEIWNQPVHQYAFRYFNPQTRKPARDFREAAIDVASFRRDRFKEYRSPDARKIVGVRLNLEFALKSVPKQRDVDSKKFDKSKRQTYTFDLEVNDAGEVIGGEWYDRRHPDFFWYPLEIARNGEEPLVEWPLGEPIPQSLRELAQRAARQGQPLASLVNQLVFLSRQ